MPKPLGQELKRHHHAATKLFLSPDGPLRELLNRFVNGEPLDTLPVLEEEVAKFRFMNIVERFRHVKNVVLSPAPWPPTWVPSHSISSFVRLMGHPVF